MNNEQLLRQYIFDMAMAQVDTRSLTGTTLNVMQQLADAGDEDAQRFIDSRYYEYTVR